MECAHKTIWLVTTVLIWLHSPMKAVDLISVLMGLELYEKWAFWCLLIQWQKRKWDVFVSGTWSRKARQIYPFPFKKSSEENTIKMCCIQLATYMAIFTSWRMENILSLFEEWLVLSFCWAVLLWHLHGWKMVNI
jgi:hypothetical protein